MRSGSLALIPFLATDNASPYSRWRSKSSSSSQASRSTAVAGVWDRDLNRCNWGDDDRYYNFNLGIIRSYRAHLDGVVEP